MQHSLIHMRWLRLVGSLKIIGLYCKRALQKRLCSVKEAYDYQEPTNRSHPIPLFSLLCEMCHMTYDLQY